MTILVVSLGLQGLTRLARRIPEGVCTALLQQVMPLLALMSSPVSPGLQASSQQLKLLAERVKALPLVLTHLKHPGQLCLQHVPAHQSGPVKYKTHSKAATAADAGSLMR